MTELGWKLSSLKCKSLISSFTSLSTMKFDCTQNILSLMWRCVPTSTWLSNIPLPQSIGCLSLFGRIPPECFDPFPTAHNTAVFTLQAYVCLHLCSPSPHCVSVRAGKLCLTPTARKVFLRKSQWPSLYTWHSAQETESSALNSGSRFFFLPVSLLPQVYIYALVLLHMDHP